MSRTKIETHTESPHRLDSSVLLGGVFALAFALTVGAQDSRPFGATEHHAFHFEVVRGANLQVCKSYAKNLRNVEWQTEPYCVRPIARSSKDFIRFELTRLSVGERERLEPQAAGLINFGDPDVYFKTYSAQLRGIQRDARTHAEDDERVERVLADGVSFDEAGRWPTAYRYQPNIDIDNDGIPDDIVFLRNTGIPCGSTVPSSNDAPARSSTDGFVMTNDALIDVERTRATFYPSLLAAADSGENSASIPRATNGWRSAPRSIGVLRFRGRTYIDNSVASYDSNSTRGVLEVYEVTRSARFMRCQVVWRELASTPDREIHND